MSMTDPLSPSMRQRVDAAAKQVVADVLNPTHPTRPLTEREQVVFDRLAKGHTRGEIARALKIAESTVRSRIGTAKLSGHTPPATRLEIASAKLDREWTSSRIATLKAGHAAGLSAYQIANSIGLGFTKNMVSGKIVALGLPARSREVGADHAKATARQNAQVQRMTTPGPSSLPQTEPRPPRQSPADVFRPLPGTKPAPFGTEHVCKWPIELGDGVHRCCGRPRPGDHAYCPQHRATSGGAARTTGKELTRSLRRYA